LLCFERLQIGEIADKKYSNFKVIGNCSLKGLYICVLEKYIFKKIDDDGFEV